MASGDRGRSVKDRLRNRAPLFYVRCRVALLPSLGTRPIRFAKFRLANAMFVWLGPLEIGWRMPWTKGYRRLIESGQA